LGSLKKFGNKFGKEFGKEFGNKFEKEFGILFSMITLDLLKFRNPLNSLLNSFELFTELL
jgi:hypothetical protein